MNNRISTSLTSSDFTQRINHQRARIGVLQERLVSGKRINRASDDPAGAEAVLKLRTSQAQVDQFKKNALASNQKLLAADDSLNGYESILDRIRSLVAQGLNDTTTQIGRDAIATELETLRDRILNISNTKYNGEYLFGGTRQNAPPFDPVTRLPSATPSATNYVQIEPGTNAISVGVRAESFLSDSTSDIFTDLNLAVTALRGTGDPAADKVTLKNTNSRLSIYADLAGVAHSKIGSNMNITDLALERLVGDFLSLESSISDIEGADFAQTAIELSQTQTALEATLQVIATGRRSLFDYLA